MRNRRQARVLLGVFVLALSLGAGIEASASTGGIDVIGAGTALDNIKEFFVKILAPVIAAVALIIFGRRWLKEREEQGEKMFSLFDLAIALFLLLAGSAFITNIGLDAATF